MMQKIVMPRVHNRILRLISFSSQLQHFLSHTRLKASENKEIVPLPDVPDYIGMIRGILKLNHRVIGTGRSSRE